MTSRHDTARAAADAIQATTTPPACLVGFDGFIDSIIHMVDSRRDMSPSGYTRLTTISAFAARCAAAAGKSTNIERVVLEDRFGGNGPLMAAALAGLGAAVTYIGAVGTPDASQVHPAFLPFASRCERVIPSGPPSATECLEFDDGKLMFNNTAAVQAVTWQSILDHVGLPQITAIVDRARLLGIVNWSLLGGVPGIWRGLMQDVFPRLSPAPRRIFIDLADPAKRSDGDIAAALGLLRDLENLPNVSVTLGLNLAEAQRIAHVSSAPAFDDSSSRTLADTIEDAARQIQSRTHLSCIVIHPREGAGAADDQGHSAWFEGPFTVTPRLSTGAGDHFNGGFAFAQVRGLPLSQCLAVGCAVSGAYVRDAKSPDTARLTQFLRQLPSPEHEQAGA